MGSVVEAGNKTGIYYVLLCGISRRATWKDVKDYARGCGLEVDHVEIYQNDIGGWVRVLGLEDFRKACEIFNGATIHGMAVQADARNEYQQVPLRYPPTSCSSSSFTTANPSLTADSYASSMSEYDPGPQTYTVPQEYVPQYIDPGYPCAFNAQIPMNPYAYPGPSVSAYQMIPRQPNVVQTERRKVLIQRLPNNMLGRDVEELIKWRFAEDQIICAGIESVDMAVNRDGKFRGHAYVLMQSYQLAVEVVNGLDRMEYQNNKLEVKLAKEGESCTTSSSSKKPDKQSTHSSKTVKTDKEKAKAENQDKIKRSVTPAIANGSGSSSRRHKKH